MTSQKGSSPRLGHRQMPVINQSDTDTETEMRRPLYSSSSNHAVTNLERNESNSSTDYEKHLQRNDSHKENLDHDTESSGEFPDFENDSDLNTAEEPENWWAFTQTQNLDKEYMESLMSNKKEVKRQENIYEFIHTEANHARTLRIMQVSRNNRKIFVIFQTLKLKSKITL